MSQLSDMFKPVSMLRSSQRVAESIRRVILEGGMEAGELLPPERTLAQRFKVTRNTVREALRQLEQLRLVSIRQGSGVRVRDYLANAGVELLIGLLAAESPDDELLRDVLELRAVVGRAILRHACLHHDLEGLPGFRQAVEALAEEAARPRPNVRALQDLEFEVHTALIRACGNRALILLYNSLRHVIRPVAHRFEFLVDEPVSLAGVYTETLDALSHQDVERAAQKVVEAFAESRWQYWKRRET